MPEHKTMTIRAGELYPGDLVDGIAVSKVRPLAKNVEVTFATGKVKRIDRSSEVLVTKIVPTIEEKREALVRQLDEAMTTVRETIASVNDFHIREKIAECTDLLYQMQWNTESWLTELHRIELYRRLGEWLERDDSPATVIKFYNWTREQILDWRPGRSTSVIHNVSDDCKLMALKNIGDEYGSGIPAVRYLVEKLEKFDVS